MIFSYLKGNVVLLGINGPRHVHGVIFLIDWWILKQVYPNPIIVQPTKFAWIFSILLAIWSIRHRYESTNSHFNIFFNRQSGASTTYKSFKLRATNIKIKGSITSFTRNLTWKLFVTSKRNTCTKKNWCSHNKKIIERYWIE